MEIHELLKLVVDREASDLHLTVPSSPVLRLDGVLIPQEEALMKSSNLALLNKWLQPGPYDVFSSVDNGEKAQE